MIKSYISLFPFFKNLWLKIFIGLIFIFIGSLFEGISITMLYPVVDKVFMVSQQDEPESKGVKAFTHQLLNSFAAVRKNIPLDFKEKDWEKTAKKQLSDQWDLLMKNFSRMDVLNFLCLFAIFIAITKNVFDFITQTIFVVISQHVIANLRNALYIHLQQYSYSFFNKQRSGDLISRVINDVEIINNVSIKNVVNLLRDLSSVVVFLFIACMVSFRLTLIVFVFFPPFFLLVGRVLHALKKHSRQTQEKIADLTFILQETISSIRIVKAFAMEDYEIDRFKKDNNRYRKSITRLRRTTAMIRPLSDIMAMLVGIALLWYGGKLTITHASGLTVGQFFVFLGALFSSMKPIKTIGSNLGDLKRGVAAVDRVMEIFATPIDIKEIDKPIEITRFNDEIKFNQVNFSYKTDTQVLHQINFQVKKGEIIALVGPSGAGKTTIVDLLPRFYDPTGGEISIDGIPLTHLKLKSLRNLMGIVTQETILFNDTIFNNIAYGKKNIDPEVVYEAARAANAHQFISEFSDGYQTMIGERGVMLSGGQRQRLAIARALMKNPDILIFDEATSALDSESEYLVQEAIDKLMKNRTVFVIAHRLSTIKHADKILVINEGRIVETGQHAELVASGGLYARLSQRQFELNSN